MFRWVGYGGWVAPSRRVVVGKYARGLALSVNDTIVSAYTDMYTLEVYRYAFTLCVR